MIDDEPDIVDFVGVVIGADGNGKYNAYRISVVDGNVSLKTLKFGNERMKKSALRVMSLDLVAISQEITRGEIEFVQDDNVA